MHACMLSHVQLRNPTDCSPPGSSVHGISQARILEWLAVSSSEGSSLPRDPTRIPCLLHWQVGPLPQAPPGDERRRHYRTIWTLQKEKVGAGQSFRQHWSKRPRRGLLHVAGVSGSGSLESGGVWRGQAGGSGPAAAPGPEQPPGRGLSRHHVRGPLSSVAPSPSTQRLLPEE